MISEYAIHLFLHAPLFRFDRVMVYTELHGLDPHFMDSAILSNPLYNVKIVYTCRGFVKDIK